jgi:hypothetical protein
MSSLDLYNALLRDLQFLRQDAGLKVGKLTEARAILNLPSLRRLASEEQLPQFVHDLLVLWVARYEHIERQEALRIAFALGEPRTAPPPGSAWTLGERRKYLARERNTSVQAIRDREDQGLTDLAVSLLTDCATLADRLLGTATGAEGAWLHDAGPPGEFSSFAAAGLVGVTLDFYRGVPWESFLSTADSLDIFLTYGRSWRRSLTAELDSFLARAASRTRVILPDTTPPNTTALPEIGKRAGQDVDTLVQNVAEARDYFAGHGAQVWATDSAELYASYRFDDIVIVTLYNHQRGQTQGVPTIICRRGGDWFDWFAADFEALIASPILTRRVA